MYKNSSEDGWHSPERGCKLQAELDKRITSIASQFLLMMTIIVGE